MDALQLIRNRTGAALAATLIVVVASGCAMIPWVPPVPDEVVIASGVTTDPAPVGTIDVPAGEVRWIEVTYRALTSSAPTLMVFELDGGSEGGTRIDVRDDRGRLVVASRSSQWYGRNVGAVAATAHVDVPPSDPFGATSVVSPSAVVDAWTCLGTCAAARYVAGTYYVSVRNTRSVSQRYDIVAYGRAPSDTNEPNDTASTATAYQLTFDGDGPTGAIERPGDADYFRLTCAASFAGPSEGMRLELASAFVGTLVLDADGGTYAVGVPTPPVPCGSTVVVRAQDGSAGPAASSVYSIVADAVPLYAIDAPAQSNPLTPTALGRLVLAPGETQVARFSFGSSSARLRYVEVVGASGVAADGRVRLEVRDDSGTIGFSTSRQRFATGLDVLSSAEASSLDVERSAISVLYQCLGPCVATRYRTGTVFARVTNTSTQTRTVDLYAYGAPETDQNEPNDSTTSATVVSVGAAGATVTGAIERLDDVDVFRLVCTDGFQFTTVFVTLETSFPGSMVVRRSAGSTPRAPGQTLEVPCDGTFRVETTDGSAGPSASSRYSVRAE
jgi:hypothetical protein